MKRAISPVISCFLFTITFWQVPAYGSVEDSLLQQSKSLGLYFSTGTTIVVPDSILKKLNDGIAHKDPQFPEVGQKVSVFTFDLHHRQCSMEAAPEVQLGPKTLPNGKWIFSKIRRLEKAPNIFEGAQGGVATFYQSEWLSMADVRSKLYLSCLFNEGAEPLNQLEKEVLSIQKYDN